ncbi:MAG TPA: DUF268 domain-containing protein [Mucilaginibacter sp.]|nr:DUF268 domain-containing protein [Mucilaginibacter sp.]
MLKYWINKIKNKLRRKKPVQILGLDEFVSAAKKTETRFIFSEDDYFPCLDDNTNSTDFDRHYIYHPAWAARIVRQINPEFHIDISSTLHFSSILSAFVPVKFYDYRPANLVLDNLTSERADLTNLHFQTESVHSLSCMHTVEHIGLGRYGDEIDYDGDLKAIRELSRVLALNGNLLFVTPIGSRARIYFNAHRVYTLQLISDLFSKEGLRLKEFTLIPENYEDGGLVVGPSPELLNKQTYGCGCFWFIKDGHR